MNQYETLLRHVYESGARKGDRTGTGTRSIFGAQMRFDLNEGFPLVTTKKVFTKAIIVELLWFLSGSTNIAYLRENGVTIWDEWADKNGELGPVYGKQWRSWATGEVVPVYGPGGHVIGSRRKTIDQIAGVVDTIKTNPNSRRMVVSAWNPADLPDMALEPCHCLFQFYVANGRLSCQVYQRSADMFLGVPFNIASYALLTHMMAQQCDLEVGDLIWTGGDCHIYNNHHDQVELQMSREPYTYPELIIERRPDSIFDYRLDDFKILGYAHHPAIVAPVAV